MILHVVAFAFLAYMGWRCLNIGFASGTLVTSLIVTLLVATGAEVISLHMVDLDHHLGAGGYLTVSLVLLVTPPGGDAIAAQAADKLGHYGALAISYIDQTYLEIGYQTKGVLAAGIISFLL